MLTSDPDQQIPFLSYGFRPFFLLAGLYAVLAMAAWVGWLAIHASGGMIATPTIAVAPHLWHGHEMIFGYAAAVIAGFMLTAIPGWTGARRVAGVPLVLLAILWLCGRGAMWFSAFLDPAVVAVLDLVFLPALAAFVAAGLILRPAPRNLIFLGLIALLILANAMVHAEWLGWADDLAARGLAGGVTTVTLMIVIVGGRVVPAFTRNALMRRGEEQRLPRSFAVLDRVAILSALAVAICLLADAQEDVGAIAALIATVTNAARLSLWRGASTLGQPILWSLHLGYAWVVAGYAALALAGLTGVIGATTAVHVLAIGAIGGMTLAIMTRASLGHTNRPLVVHRTIALAYLMVAAAAMGRVLGPALVPSRYFDVMIAAGGLWIAGFAIFTAVYLPILTGPPAPTQNGGDS